MVDPRRGPAEPSSAAPASGNSTLLGRTLLAFDGSFPQFLLLLLGGTCLVAGLWNSDRHEALHDLGDQLEVLQEERDALRELADEEFRYHEAVEADPRVSEDWLRRFFQDYSGAGVPLDEWIRRKYDQPDS